MTREGWVSSSGTTTDRPPTRPHSKAKRAVSCRADAWLRFAARRHRTARVEQDFGPGTDFVAIEPHHQRIAAGIRRPVDVANVVPRHVLAVFLELERTSRSAAEQLAGHSGDGQPG